jgi:hypothetical protein
MFKFRLNKIQAVFFIIFGILLITSIAYSSQSDFVNPKKCSDIFENCGNTTTDDSCQPFLCNGTQSSSSVAVYVKEVYINATKFVFGSEINATCEFQTLCCRNNWGYMWYYDGSNWYILNSSTNFTQSDTNPHNYSVIFKVNSSENTHIIRCVISFNDTGITPQINKIIPNECANSTYSKYFDNDDANFTVTDYFKYDSWNLTNYTTDVTILDGVNLTRNDLINASVHWNKDISVWLIRHNGTGNYQNYTFLGPSPGNWTNYTLVLSNMTEFNATGPIEVSYIWANDTFGLANYTSPSHYFYLWGNSKLSNITVNDTVIYNKTAVQTLCKVEDANTNLGISNYNVSFYQNNTFLNTVSTNASGWANYSYLVNATAFPTNFNITCNITDDPEKYYNETSENSKNTSLDVVELGIQVSLSSSSLVYGNNVEITANISGNASEITNVNANITFTNFTNGQYVLTSEIRNLTFNQVFSPASYQYNLTYTPTIPSNYSVNITVTSEQQRFNTTNFEVWGYSKLTNIILNSTKIYNSTAAKINCRVVDNYTNSGIPGYNISFHSNNTYLNSSLTNNTGWANLSYIFNIPTLGNLTILCNMTNSPSLYYNKSSENSNNTILEVVSPYEVLLGGVYFKYGDNDVSNKINLLDTNFKFNLQVYDPLQMESVTLNLTYPENAINVSLNMSGDTSAGEQSWTYQFNDSSYPLNMTGTYTIGIIAKNSYGFQNISTNYTTFYVNDTYNLGTTSSDSTYMRGENITIVVYDVIGNGVSDLNWTVNITKNNVTIQNTTVTTNYIYQIRPDDPVGNYTILVINATKNRNHGNLTFDFNVSRNFSISYDPSPPAIVRGTTISFISITLKNARDTTHTPPVSANISCHNSSLIYTMFPLTFTNGVVNNFYDCTAPSSDGSYNITMNVTDEHNNTGYEVISYQLTTSTTTTVPLGGGGGGGGGLGGTNKTEIIPPENCTDKKDNDKDNKTDCADEDCFYHPSCLREIKELNFTLSTDTIEIEQGSDGIVLASLLNNGNVPLLLNSSLEKECCNISTPIGFELKVKEETQFSVNVHIPLYQKEGEYTVKVKLSSGPLTKEKAFKIIVKKSPSIIKLEELEKRLTELGSTVTDYQVVGLSVGGLMKTVDESKSDIDTAKTAIENDDLNALQNYISKLEEKVNSLSSTLPGFGVQKFLVNNKWNITDGVLLIVASVYLVTQVLIPYVKLTAEMTKLRFEELAQSASRKKTETQYFFRKIDEQTFRKIVSEKHSQVLKLQSTITLKKQQRSDLIRKKLNPLSLVEFIKTKTAKKKT